jgi:hypothetical protein
MVPAPWSHRIHVHDADTIECKVWGTYERHWVTQALGHGSTGPIRVRDVSALSTAKLEGADAHASYSITWSIVRVP